MCLLAPDGTFLEVNPALCEFFGYDAETLAQMTWQKLTPPEFLHVGDEERNAVFDGRRDSYRIVKQYVHADGHRIWADVAVNCARNGDGQVEHLASQIIDITDEVRTRERLAQIDEQNRLLAQRLQQQSDRLAAELESAAGYMASIMPSGLAGEVGVSSRYLPSRALGGDCFNYTWIDDDHLLVYLIDVSGHGIEPALLSVSVHNLLRSGTIDTETLLKPEAILAELNQLFQMDRQNHLYFTMWIGVYEASIRTLRYASAGAPPALAFNTEGPDSLSCIELSTPAAPVGVFEDTVYTSAVYPVPHGCRIFVYSDGASELHLASGRQLTSQDFLKLCSRRAGSPGWSLDGFIEELRAMTPDGEFEDDCALIELTFD